MSEKEFGKEELLHPSKNGAAGHPPKPSFMETTAAGLEET